LVATSNSGSDRRAHVPTHGLLTFTTCPLVKKTDTYILASDDTRPVACET
jgi:hypothetical protein